MIDKSEIQKQKILELLSNEDVAVLSLAYMYAENFHKYGFDVTEKCLTATEQMACMNRAYIRGRQDEAERYGDLSRIEKKVARPDWEEMMVICDNCGHAIHVKRMERQE